MEKEEVVISENKAGNGRRFFNNKASLAALVSMLISLVVIFLLLFMPVIHVDMANSTGTAGGPDYVGWQVAFYYPGELIAQGTFVFGFNLLLSLAIVLPVITLTVLLLMWKNAKNIKRSVILFIAAAVIIFCAAVFLNVFDLAMTTASSGDGGQINMIKEINDSPDKGIAFYAVFNFIACIIAAVVQIALGVINILKKDVK